MNHARRPPRGFKPSVVLAVGAHADDIDVPAGGTLAKWAARGAAVYLLILTTGDRGTDNPSHTPADVTAHRRAEQQAAADILGIKEVSFADYGDCELENTPVAEVRGHIVRLIRELGPDTMVFWDPALEYSLQGHFSNHPDHRVAGRAALDAAALFARNARSYPEYPGTHAVNHMFMINPDAARYHSRITGYTAAKAEALAAHASQGDLHAEAARFGPTTRFGIGPRRAHGLPVIEPFVYLNLCG
jgi:LmbE family N-acetylglucosaminyl deacetylase